MFCFCLKCDVDEGYPDSGRSMVEWSVNTPPLTLFADENITKITKHEYENYKFPTVTIKHFQARRDSLDRKQIETDLIIAKLSNVNKETLKSRDRRSGKTIKKNSRSQRNWVNL